MTTVADFIKFLNTIEDKSIPVVFYNSEYGTYDDINNPTITSVPETRDTFDEFKDNVKHIDVILL